MSPSTRDNWDGFSDDLLSTQRRNLRTERAQARLGDDIKKNIFQYIKNPTRVGIWRLQATWQPTGGISKPILDQIDPKIQRNEVANIKYENKVFRVRLKDREASIESTIKNKITFVIQLFKMLSLGDSSSDFLSGLSLENQILYSLMDVEAIKPAFSEAIDCFKEKIDIDDIDIKVQIDNFNKIKRGSFFLATSLKNSLLFKCFALFPEPLEDLRDFLLLAGKIKNPQIRHIFSPEEEVFEPYFPFVRLAHSGIDQDNRLQSLYQRAFEEYESQRYEICIAALGLIAEDYLTQVYETLFRDVAPKGKTLGQLYDSLHTEIKILYKKEPPQLSDLSVVYNEINDILKRIGGNHDDDLRQVLTLVRSLVNTIKNDRNYVSYHFKELQNREFQVSVFPKEIRSHINEIIRNRNAAAHKTRVPLGNYEALRTMYALVAFVMWWRDEVSAIDWRTGKLNIIDSFVKKSEPD